MFLLKYEGRSFNSSTNEPQNHMAVRNSWKLRYFHGGVVLNNGIKLCLNPFTCSKVIENSTCAVIIHWLKMCLMKAQKVLK